MISIVMSQQTLNYSSASPQNDLTAPASWSSGWYVFFRGKTTGPYSVEYVFELDKNKSFLVTETFVTRTGFSQWYPLHDFKKLFSHAYQKSKETQRKTIEFQSKLNNDLNRLKELEKVETLQKSVPLEYAQKKMQETVREEVKEFIPQEFIAPKENVEIKPIHITQPKTHPSPAKFKHIPTLRSKVKSKRESHVDLFILRSTLRLGFYRSPASIFFSFFYTFGFSWISWFEETWREVIWHLSEKHPDKNFPDVRWAKIPFVHTYMTFQFAKLVREIEIQNQYELTSPWLATLLSLCPPLCMIYLQQNVNRHWELHLKMHLHKK